MNENTNCEKWMVLVNPNAGSGKGKRDWVTIESLLRDEGIPFTMRLTEEKGHAINLTLEGIGQGFRKFITVGGDGTLNEVLNGVFQNGFCSAREITLALIPVGTGNDWGRMFGIPLDYSSAIKVINKGSLFVHDIGLVKYHDGEEKRERYFINIAGLGFESVVVRKSNFQKEKGRGGKAIYFYNLLTSLLSYRNTAVEVEIDKEKINGRIFSINVGNGRYCGGGMRQTPDAMPDDGMLDVTIIKDVGKIEIIKSLKMLYDGTILKHKDIDGYRCKNVKVKSNSILYVEADGESLGHSPAEFSIVPGAINIVSGTTVIQ